MHLDINGICPGLQMLYMVTTMYVNRPNDRTKFVKIKNVQTAALLLDHFIIFSLFRQCADLWMRFKFLLIIYFCAFERKKIGPQNAY